MKDGRGQPDALPESLGEVADGPDEHAGDVALLDHLAHPPPAGRRVQATHVSHELQVVLHQHVAVKRSALWQVAELRLHFQRVLDDVVAGDRGCSRAGQQVAHEDLHGRGLAGSVRAEQSDDLTRLDRHGDAAQGVGFSVVLRQVPDLDHAFLPRTTVVATDRAYCLVWSRKGERNCNSRDLTAVIEFRRGSRGKRCSLQRPPGRRQSRYRGPPWRRRGCPAGVTSRGDPRPPVVLASLSETRSCRNMTGAPGCLTTSAGRRQATPGDDNKKHKPA